MKHAVSCLLAVLLLYGHWSPVAAEGPPAEPLLSDQAEPPEEFFLDEEEEVRAFDPIEPFNRGVFWFNDKFYFYLLKPVARAYRVVPEPARVSVSNFFSNLYTPQRFVNSLLQFRFRDGAGELFRFVMNSTIGILGLFDPARTVAGISRKDEDFGQTLGRFGAGGGFYMVWPFFGPTNLRDGLGGLVDGFLDPVYYFDIKAWERFGIKALDTVNATSLDKDTYESIKEEALDPYVTIRNAYSQRREGLIRK